MTAVWDSFASIMFLNPTHLISALKIQKGDYVADFGAGHGHFAIPLAERVGGDGRVWALDINRHAIDIIRREARLRHLVNIHPVWTDIEAAAGSGLKENFMDVAVAANLLHQCRDGAALFREAGRILHEDGRLLVVEWSPESVIGPPRELRIPPGLAAAMARAAGFTIADEHPAGQCHYALEFRKR
ncbi:MAG: class I SAM-dependent methyltransferase [Patescibacteria group bacterium]